MNYSTKEHYAPPGACPITAFIRHWLTERSRLATLDPGKSQLRRENMARRTFLAQLAGLPFLALGTRAQESKRPLKIMMKGAWGPDDPTRASFPFLHGLALAEAGHNVQIYLLSDATSLMRTSTVNAIFPVGWPPLSETLAKVVAKHIPIYSCGACSRARDVTEADLNRWGAKFGSPPIFVSIVEWADRIIVE
jgi:predicted peroxiredoxin